MRTECYLQLILESVEGESVEEESVEDGSVEGGWIQGIVGRRGAGG